MLVNMSSLDALMTKPKSDRCDIDTLGPQQHGICMSSGVGGNSLSSHRRAGGGCGIGVFDDQCPYGMSAQGSSLPGREQWVRRFAAAFLQPRCQCSHGLGGAHTPGVAKPRTPTEPTDPRQHSHPARSAHRNFRLGRPALRFGPGPSPGPARQPTRDWVHRTYRRQQKQCD